MIEGLGLVVWMNVYATLGSGEARPFIRLKDGTQCELFAPTCIVRAEANYGQKEMELLRRQVLDDIRKTYEVHK
jgi:hypothetical protein